MIAESRREGLLEEEESALLAGALRFGQRPVGELAHLAADMVTVPLGSTPEQVEALSAATGFSRFPVVQSGGELVGYLHLKDVLETDPARRRTPVPRRSLRALASVSAGDDLGVAMAAMQRARAHLARVLPDPVPVPAGPAGATPPAGPVKPAGPLEPAGASGSVGPAEAVVALEDIVEQLVGETRDLGEARRRAAEYVGAARSGRTPAAAGGTTGR